MTPPTDPSADRPNPDRAQKHEDFFRFRAAMDNSSDAIYLIDRGSMRFVEVNQTACERMQYSREELLRMGPQDLLVTSREEIERQLDAVIAAGGKGIATESVSRAKDGQTAIFELHRHAVRWEEGWFIVSVARDITRTKRAEALSRLEHEVTRSLAEADNSRKGLRAVMRSICESERLETGGYFQAEGSDGATRLILGWSSPGVKQETIDYYKSAIQTVVPAGGLLSRVLAEQRPIWVADLQEADTSWPERVARSQHRATFAFPVFAGKQIIGVFSFSSAEIREPDEPLLRAVRAIGEQVGQLVKRKEAEDALRASQMQLQSILGSTADGILAVDHQGKVIQTNRRFAELWRIPQAVLDSRDDGLLLDHVVGQLADPQGFMRNFQALCQSDAEFLDAVNCRDGRTFERYTSAMQMNGVVVGRVWSFRDITERRQREEELRRFRAAMEATEDSIYLTDRDSMRFLDVNAGACAALGLSREQILALGPPGVLGVPREELERSYDALIANPNVPAVVEMPRRRADGRNVWVEIRRHAQRSAGGWMIITVSRDITERKRAEQALRESEDRFRSLVQLSSDWFWQQDQAFRFVSTGSTAGDRPEILPPGFIGKTLWELFDTGSCAADWAQLRARLYVHQPYRDFQLTHLNADFGTRYLSVSGEPVFGAGGEFLGYRGVGRDITALKTEERLLRLEHAVTRCLANAVSAPDALREVLQVVSRSENWECIRYFRHDEAADVMRFDQGWASGGAAMQEFVARSAGVEYARGVGLIGLAWQSGNPVWSADVARDARTVQLALARDAGIHGAFVFPAVFEGRTFGVLVISSANIRAPGERLLQTMGVIASQIGQFVARVRAEDAVRSSEEKFSKVFYASPDAIALSKLDTGEFLEINEGFERITGHPRAEAIGRSALELGVWTEAAQRQSLIERIGAGQAADVLEATIRRKDGSERAIAIWLNAINVAGEKCVLSIFRDVTAQKQAERERAALELQLRQAQKMEAVGTLAGGIAHDFNNIIGAILGNAELARQDVGALHPAQQSIAEIDKAGRRARDLVQQILAFSRKQPLARSVIALGPVVDEALKLLRALLPASVRLAADNTPGPPNVLADPTQIHQVLVNLCTNAWHAMDGRAGEIAISLEEVEVDAALAGRHADLRPGRYVRMSVRDSGKGMDAATRERIFEPFFTTKPVGEGTGLGLSVVLGIMQGHEGAIAVESTPGRGTTFQLYFPRVDSPDAVAGTPALAPAAPAGGQRHVLYLDDDEALVSLVERMLGRRGYRVSGHTLPSAALAAVRADPAGFDLVVSDFNMPGMSGLDVARELARIRPDLPVALISGYITDELREAAPQAGVRHLIYKPNTIEDLCETVRRLTG